MDRPAPANLATPSISDISMPGLNPNAPIFIMPPSRDKRLNPNTPEFMPLGILQSDMPQCLGIGKSRDRKQRKQRTQLEAQAKAQVLELENKMFYFK